MSNSPGHTSSYRLTQWVLRHPVTVIMTFVALITLGILAYMKIPLQFMPRGFNPPFMGVFFPYPNANAYEVDEKIADPVMKQLRTVRKLKNIRANSSGNGCFIFLEFQANADMDTAYLEVRNQIERIRPDLPREAERYRIWKFNPNDEPVLWISFAFPENMKNPFRVLEEKLQRPLMRIKGIGKIEINGIQEPEVLIELKQEALQKYNIGILDLITKIQNQNFSLEGGHITHAGVRYYIRSNNRWDEIKNLKKLLLTPSGITLGDVARIRVGSPERTSYLFINFNEGGSVEVFKEASASSISISREVRAFLRELKKDPQFRDWNFDILFDEGEYIYQSIRDLEIAGIYGGLLATLILFFFLGNIRMTLNIALAMPLSILMTIMTMYFSGETLNLVTMMGLMLAIGMVVDNAVVVVESIDRYRTDAYSRFQSVLKGTSEVALAILVATGTTLVVFLPLILLQEDAGFAFYFKKLGFPVCIAITASLIVALVFIPVGNLFFLSRKRRRNPWIEYVREKYGNLMDKVLTSPFSRTIAFFLILIIFVSMFYPFKRIKKTMMTEGNVGDFRIILDLPPNFSLEQSKEAALQVVGTLLKHKDELDIRVVYSRVRSGWTVVRVFLKDKDHRKLSRDEVIARTRKILPPQPGVKYRFGWRDMGGSGTLTVSLTGKDVGKLQALMQNVTPRLERIPEIVSIEIPTELKTSEIRMRIGEWVSQKVGVNPLMLGRVLAFAIRGYTLFNVFPYQENYINMRIIFSKEDRSHFERLLNIPVPTAQGQTYPVRSVARWAHVEGIGEIERSNGKIRIPLTLHLKQDADMGKVIGKIRGVLDSYPWPAQYGWEQGARWRSYSESQSSQKFALGVAIVLVFLLMGTLFESVLLPFCVILSIPFAFVGTYWLLYLTNTQFDLMAGIGLVLLIGIVVNNAIVLIDRVNQLRHEGYSIHDALVEGGKQRFRPIWMTALTTIMGMLPMALGHGEIVGISYAPLARAVIGGLFTSTVVTLFIVPLMYYTIMTSSERFQRFLAFFIQQKRTVT